MQLLWSLVAGAALLTGLASPAQAGLGGDARSVETDRIQLKAAVAVTPGTAFTVHQLTLPSGTVVREYLSPAGKIFAVAWSGVEIPNLQQTLGDYYSAASAALNNAPRGPDHRHRSAEQADVAVYLSAHLRDYSGLVYVPALLPRGVSPGDLRQ
jgi:hypothetical protein